MSEIAELSEAVGQVLSALVGRPASVSNMERLSGGASRVTWSVDAIVDDDPLPLILQRTRGGGSPTGIGAATEAALLRAAHAAGVPTAEVVAAVGDPGLDGPALAGALEVLGDGWVLQARLAGETRPARLLRDEEWAEARAALVAECGAALAAIHRIPAASVPGLEPGDRLVRFRDVLDGFDEPRPAFELGLRWLAAHQPVGRPSAAVVHGDFRTGNLLVDRRGLAAVLDWELAHLGDPLEDLGWFCVRAWRFGSPKPAGGFGTRARLVAAYEAHGGGPVDPAVLRWWEVMGTLSWGVICLIQAATHLSGASRSVELAAIGRRVAETELDLLRLLPGPDPEPDHEDPVAEPAPPSVRGVPTAGELIEATREWIEGDVAAATEGRVAFHAKVAANVLAMVERELALGPAAAARQAARLATFGAADEAALAAAIRSGALDDRHDEVMAAVGARVLDELAVANPTYGNRP